VSASASPSSDNAEAPPPHVVLALEQDGVGGVVAVIDRLQVGQKLGVVGQAAHLQPFFMKPHISARLLVS
jgi:hypothetical protein